MALLTKSWVEPNVKVTYNSEHPHRDNSLEAPVTLLGDEGRDKASHKG